MPHFIVYGDAPFLIEETVQVRVQASGLPTAVLKKQTTPHELLNEVQQVSLFAQASTLYLWQEPDFLTRTGDEEFALWEKGFKVAATYGHVIGIVFRGNLDNRRKSTKMLLQHAEAIPCMQFKEWEHDKWLTWVQQRVRKLTQKPCDREVCEALLTSVGYDYGILHQTIVNVGLYSREKTILVSDVLACTSTSSVSVFELLEALRKGVSPVAVRLLMGLVASGEEPVAMIGLIASQWRLYLQILEGLAQKQTISVIAKTVARQPYYIEKLVADIRLGYKIPSLTRGLIALHAADLAIKSGRQKPEEALLIAMSQCRP